MYSYNTFFQIKGTIHPQKKLLKYVMLRTVTKYSTIIITKYTCFHRSREIIQIIAIPEARFELESGKEKTQIP